MSVKPSASRNWLISAFEPFNNRPTNNSIAVLDEFKKLAIEAHDASIQFHYLVLPVEYDRCFEVLRDHIEQLEMDGIRLEGILSLGEGAEEFKLETQANNIDDVPEVADNAGVKRTGQKIFKDLEKTSTILLRFPFEAFSRIRSSKNPGFFVCNHLCARMGRELAERSNAPFFGFIHVPKTGSGGMFTPDVCAAVIFNGFRKL